MGVLNLTPDSFSDGGRFLYPEKAVEHALHLVREGADLLDLGAESTRPGAEPVSEDEEWRRLEPVLLLLAGKTTVPLSIDTTKPKIARCALAAGAHIINDVSGLADPQMADVVRTFGAGLILMHRRGNPKTMQSLTHYEDTVAEILKELRAGIDRALQAGIVREQLVIDPGLGFAKDAGQNIEILRELGQFHSLGLPVLLGPSRKSFIGKVTGREIGDREYGTAAVAGYAVTKGVHILRVHDVGAARDAVRITRAIQGASHVRSL